MEWFRRKYDGAIYNWSDLSYLNSPSFDFMHQIYKLYNESISIKYLKAEFQCSQEKCFGRVWNDTERVKNWSERADIQKQIEKGNYDSKK